MSLLQLHEIGKENEECEKETITQPMSRKYRTTLGQFVRIDWIKLTIDNVRNKWLKKQTKHV